jgi:hypothetical protein
MCMPRWGNPSINAAPPPERASRTCVREHF